MIAVHLGAEEVEHVLSSMRLPDLSVACYNGAADCVVAGPLKDLRAFKLFLDNHVQCETTLLQVPFGYHSSAMDPVLGDLSIAARAVTTLAPSIPIASNVSGELVFPGDETHFDTSYFTRHCVKPVQFHNSVASLLSKFNIDAWIEIGPHATVLPMLKLNPLIQRNVLLLPSLHKRHDAWHSLTSSLSLLYTSGIPVLWRAAFSHLESISCISLPSYPFTKSKFWVPYCEQGASRERAVPESSVLKYSLLRSFTQYPCAENGFVSRFETPVNQISPYIIGHCVGGVPLCPASLYIEQVFAGIELSTRRLGINSFGNHPILRKMKFPSPLVYKEGIDRTIIVTITVGEETGSFEVASQADVSEKLVHAQGQYRLRPSLTTMSKFAHLQPVVDRRVASILKPHSGSDSEMFSRRTVYDVIFPRVVRYSKEYQTIKSMFVGADGMEGYAEFAVRASHRENTFNVHPIFIDTLLHVAGFVSNLNGDGNDAYICCEVGTLKALPEQIQHNTSYAVYCSHVWLPEQNVIIADAYAISTSQPKKVVACMKGVHFRRIRLKSFVKRLHMGSGLGAPERMNLSLVTDKLCLSEHRIHPKQSSVTDVTSSVTALVAAACNVDQSDLRANADFSFLGVDSLMSIEISQSLQSMFPETKLDIRDLCRCRTVEQLVDEIRATLLIPIASTTVTRSASGASSPRTLVFDDQLAYPNSNPPAQERYNVKEIISSVLDININVIRDDQELQLLGLDSLTTIEALHELRKQFGSVVPSNLFVFCNTIHALQDYFDIHSRANTKPVESKSGSLFNVLPVLRLDTIPYPLQVPDLPSDRTPLILIHDGSGLTTYYDRLTSLNRAVWAINNPHFETADPWDSISKMAGCYADRVRHLEQPSIIIGGKFVYDCT